METLSFVLVVWSSTHIIFCAPTLFENPGSATVQVLNAHLHTMFDANLVWEKMPACHYHWNHLDEILFLLPWHLAEGVVLQEPGEDEEEVGLRHRLPETAPTTRSERHVTGWMLSNGTTLIEEMLFDKCMNQNKP